MFPKDVYIQRRKRLIETMSEGLIILPGNIASPINYSANTYKFRQDSNFLYYFGLDEPGMYGIIDIDSAEQVIYGNELDIEDIIWMGKQQTIKEKSEEVGIIKVKETSSFIGDIKIALQKNRKIHFCLPYQIEIQILLANSLNISFRSLSNHISKELIQAIIDQRSIKDIFEIVEIETTINNLTRPAFLDVLNSVQEGKYEYEIAGIIESHAAKSNCCLAFPTICTINGQILHNNFYGNRLKDGRLLLIDYGIESQIHYATDITRTIPVSGKYTAQQKNIYDLVLKTQKEAIQNIQIGKKYFDIHMEACKTITEGLKSIELMQGNTNEAVVAGAHTLFFPHGLGHMLGLDAHDMENLGEDFVGYDEGISRSNQFGTAYLRLAKELQEGYVITVEPGIYFIPALIEKWKAENVHNNFINYKEIDHYLDFGGIRIEDDVLVKKSGAQVLGKEIPKEINNIELF